MWEGAREVFGGGAVSAGDRGGAGPSWRCCSPSPLPTYYDARRSPLCEEGGARFLAGAPSAGEGFGAGRSRGSRAGLRPLGLVLEAAGEQEAPFNGSCSAG